MSPTAAQILEQALQLDENERIELGLTLIGTTRNPLVKAEVREAQRRLAEVESGAVTPLEDDDAQRLIADHEGTTALRERFEAGRAAFARGEAIETTPDAFMDSIDDELGLR